MKPLHNLLAVSGLMIAGDVGPYTTYTNKKRKLVFYDRAPPKDPASQRQRHMRASFKAVAFDWSQQSDANKKKWEEITQRTYIRMTGYNLFLACELTLRGRNLLPNLLRQAGIPSAPPFTIRGPTRQTSQHNVK